MKTQKFCDTLLDQYLKYIRTSFILCNSSFELTIIDDETVCSQVAFRGERTFETKYLLNLTPSLLPFYNRNA